LKKLLLFLTLFTVALFGLAIPARAVDPPVLSVGVITATSIQLNWTDADNEDGYRVREVLPGGVLNTLIVLGPNVLTYTVPDLAEETTHTYRVVAFITGGTAKASNDVTATTGTTTTTTTPPPLTCTGVQVTAPASIQAAINANPTGTAFCLSGSFTISSPIQPKDGQSFTGPADITGSTHSGFELKGVESGANVFADDVTLETLTIHGFSIRGIECWAGTQMLDIEVYDNARNGLGCGLDDEGGVLVADSYIHDNGSTEELGRGGGGMKFARSGGVTVRDSVVELNVGNGIWCDVDCGSFTVTGNTVSGNTRKGIFFEISFGPALIENNTVTDNNCVPAIWGSTCSPQNAGAPGGGIAMNSSCPDEGPGCIIRNNILGGNMVAGINFRDDGRDYPKPFEISVTGNDLNGDALLKCGTMGIICSGNTP
jgi:parallel beta-helix repeat protein